MMQIQLSVYIFKTIMDIHDWNLDIHNCIDQSIGNLLLVSAWEHDVGLLKMTSIDFVHWAWFCVGRIARIGMRI